MTLSSEPRTIRLHNVDPGRSQLSLHLTRIMHNSASRLRRGVHMLPIVIVAGRYYDVCKELSVDFEEARRLVDTSPEVKAHESAKRLIIREFPPTVEQAAAQEKVDARQREGQALTDALNPPDAPGAVPAGVARAMSMSELGLPENTPVQKSWPGPVVPQAPEPEGDEGAPEFDDTVLEPLEDTTAESTEPSMDWSEETLRKYADEHSIDVGKAKTKTLILKKIREAISAK